MGSGNSCLLNSETRFSSESICASLIEKVRRLAEACDCLDGLSMLHFAGDTLSTSSVRGFLPKLRDSFGKAIITSYPVLPTTKLAVGNISDTLLTLRCLE